ncbi:MAG: hypothetical protein J6D09_06825 [Clostridia bacterium]|nr:hypothetical protein [Clostridia bacterium]
MYANIGKKIMTLAIVIAVITMIASGCYGLYLAIKGQTVIGIVTMILGPIACWIAGFFLYGFGRLIDNTDYIARKMGRRDGYGIPDVSDKLDWSTPEEDDADEEAPQPQSFIAQRIVTEKDSDKND